MKLEINFYSDPSHGWAQIPHQLIHELGISGRISRYSYTDQHYAYLEEDCDLSLFMQTAEGKGWEINFKDQHTNSDSFIRNYQRYTEGV